MIRNVFIKSIQRQPVRYLILTLLIGAAAFAFVLRATEYIIVSNEINRIGGYYRAVGFVADVDNARWDSFACTTDPVWQEIIADSPYLGYSDTRKTFTGHLNNNTNVNLVKERLTLFYEDFLEIYYPITDAYFYGTLTETSVYIHGARHVVFLYFMVDEIVLSHPEYVAVGKEVRLTVPVDDINNPQHQALTMREGERYLLRGSWCGKMNVLIDSPHSFWVNLAEIYGGEFPFEDYYALNIRPLIEGTDIYFSPSSDPGLDDILAKMEQQLFDLDHNMRVMELRTTTDMTAMYTHTPHIQLAEGRLLTREDYLQANPVAVVHQLFASSRGLGIGDILEFTLEENTNDRFYGFLHSGHTVEWDDTPHTLSLEIVGIYDLPEFPNRQTIFSLRVFVPESMMPPGFGYTVQQGGIDNNFTFVLRSARDIDNFNQAHGAALAALGYAAQFVTNPGAEDFFIAVDSIMLTMTFNVILFSVLAVLILALGSFIYILFVRKNFVIMRSMGHSSAKTIKQLVYPIFVGWLVATIAGAFAAWRLALDMSSDTLAYVYELGPDMLHMARKATNDLGLVVLSSVSVIAAFFALVVGGIILSRKPILRLLQGR